MSWWGILLLLAVLAACWAERRRAKAEADRAERNNRETRAALEQMVTGRPAATTGERAVHGTRHWGAGR